MYAKSYAFYETKCDVRGSVADLYTEERGYGFLNFKEEGNGKDRFTGTGGWRTGEGACLGPKQNEQQEAGSGSERQGFRDSAYGAELMLAGYPLRFRASVPQKGVYRVSVAIQGGDRGLYGLNLYTNRRNLVKRDIIVEAGETFRTSFYVNVCEYQPVVGEPMKLDASVYVTVICSNFGQHIEQESAMAQREEGIQEESTEKVCGQRLARLSSVTIEEASAPTIFLGGDSLVTDYEGQYPDNPLCNFGSWGQNLLSYFPKAAVSNQAHGGMTTNCFRDDGHFEIVSRNLKPGDIFLMQFGHNDQKRRNLKAYVQYAANLRWYIGRIREKGAYPVIVTSLSRIPNQDEDGYYDLLEEYAQSCLKVGRECHVPVIDLHAFSFELMCKAGTEVCKDYFMDVTHTNDYGALIAVGFIAKEIRRQGIAPLVELMDCTEGSDIQEDAQAADVQKECAAVWKPDLFYRPAGALSSAEKEEKPVLPTDLPDLPYADCRGIRQEQGLKEAMWKGLLDPCIRYYHPFEELPRAQFLYLYFKAVKAPAGRPYQGYFCDMYRYEFDAQAVQKVLDGGLLDLTTTPDYRFRPDEGLTGGELVSFMVRSLHEPGHREIDMQECERQARGLGLLWEGYGRHVKVNRADATVALVKLMNVSREAVQGLPQ